MNLKIKFFLAVAATMAMFMLTSCEKNDAPMNQDEMKSFFIKIGKSAQLTRAEGDDISDKTVTFSDGYLIFTTGSRIGHVINIVATAVEESDITVEKLEQGVEILEIPAATTNVYLYGNLGNSISGIENAAKKGNNISAVWDLVWSLSDIQNSENSVAAVPVFGKGDVAPGSVNSDRLESKFPVGPIGSRLQIGEIKCSDSNVEELKLAGIFINGFYKSMAVNSTFDGTNLVDNGIDISKYTASGYSDYTTMADIFSTAVDIRAGSATPSVKSHWAYNFFPAEMPHIVLHFTSIKANGTEVVDNKFATVSKYSTSASGGAGNEYSTALAGRIYTLNIDITDYATQVDDLPESNSSVTGYIEIEIIDWEGVELYPEW